MEAAQAHCQTPGTPPDAVADLRAQLLVLDLDVTDRIRVTTLRELADLTNTISAVQARLICDLDASQTAADDAADVPKDRRRGVTGRVASALRESPRNAQVAIGVAKALVKEMPHTFNALAAGTLTWSRARLLVSETACLSLADRRTVDREVCGDLAALDGVGTRKLAAKALRAGYVLDPVSAVRRAAKAESERYVSLRPAPDCLTWLTALLPVAQGVACYAALKAAATSGIATGDGRGLGQLTADTLVTRITGQATADAVPIGLHLVMPSHALLGGDCAPGRIVGHGPIPAALARRLVAAAPTVASWVKRLYEGPTGLVATESRSRCFPEGLAELITIRDDTCATPWCDARSDTSTTPPRGLTADPPRSPTGRACARSATRTSRTEQPQRSPGPISTVRFEASHEHLLRHRTSAPQRRDQLLPRASDQWPPRDAELVDPCGSYR